MRYIELPGGVRYTANPTARGYRIRWTDHDGRPRDTFRVLQQDAQQLAYELAGLAVKHETGAPQRHDAPVSLLVSTYLDTAAERRLLARQTLAARRSYLNVWALPVIGDLPCHLWDLDATWRVVDRARPNLQPSSLKTLARALAACATFGTEHGFLEPSRHPVKGLKLPSAPRQELDLPTADDVEKLAVCMVEITGQPWRALQVYLMCYSGLRAGEMLGVWAEDFNLDTGELSVRRQAYRDRPNEDGPPKWGSARTTVWPAWMDELVADHVHRVGEGPLFPGAGTMYEPYSSFRGERFGPARERAGWPRRPGGRHRWTPHTLRHYFCTWALSKDGLNLDPADVARMAGHRSPKTTWETYIQVRPDGAVRAREASRGAAR